MQNTTINIYHLNRSTTNNKGNTEQQINIRIRLSENDMSVIRDVTSPSSPSSSSRPGVGGAKSFL